MRDRESRAVVLRLVAEFVVIVVGVLVALGFDSWTADRRDRALEAEYMERLLEDVRYDLDELAFVDTVSKLGGAVARALNAPGAVDAMPASEMVAALFVVANARVPDLSRSTFEELINSGQIELLESHEIRRTLASYDRTVSELASAWNTFDPDLWLWVSSRVPQRVHGRFQSACSAPDEGGLYTFEVVCTFDLGGWSADSLRSALASEEAVHRLRRAEYNYGAHQFFVSVLADEARALEAALAEAISGP